MFETHDFNDPVQEVEALIRAAGDYVQPTDDLRPRVLEVVRSFRIERLIQRRIWQAAILFIALNLLGTSTLQQVELADITPRSIARDRDAAAEGSVYHDGESWDEHWDTVESFRELRRRQAYLLRLHL